ncbi:adenosine deaminase [Actinokineospora sp. NBRC 105648]|uniref:adenosine deaminase n=1 Tax=Actinokineospora sp. NBRC 105648 TaxID=3032206 RepID=UPI0024A0740B|nr:adenosine deaminase [Actinokineospora sp. NBRC 105648]GLZ37225.1 adenosine deaminase [Actinokineospora sp. NBRC 105648]
MRELSRLPKAHLHVHLESTVRPETLVAIGAGNGVAVGPEVSHGPFAFAGFRAFADQNSLVRDCLRRPEDFRRVAVEYCADEAAQGTGYAEVTFTAASHGERLGDLAMPLEAVLDGLAQGQREHGIVVRVLLDHSRRRSPERLRRTIELARRFSHRGVVGVGLAGDETYPLAPFADLLGVARDAGLRLVHHAGEVAGAASVLEAVTAGGADRVGHGFRVLEDPAVVAEVRDRGVPLEVCVSSNVALGLVPSVRAHPLPELVAAGLVVTVNTDVPNVTGRGLAEEYGLLRSVFGWDDAALAGLARASVRASFAPPETKAELLAGVGRWLG